MCCHFVNFNSDSLFLKDEDTIVCWKVLLHQKEIDQYCSPIFFTGYKKGRNKSSRRLSQISIKERNQKKISKGIHVLISEDAAFNYGRGFYLSHTSNSICFPVIVPVKCQRKHFVGYSRYVHEAVFSEVFIEKLKGENP